LKKYGLPKKSIIKSKAEINNVFRNGIIFNGKFFKFFVQLSDTTRVAFAVERGCNSVKRNRLKRRSRELWRTLNEKLTIKANIIILVRKSAEKEPFQNLREEVVHLLEKIQKKCSS